MRGVHGGWGVGDWEDASDGGWGHICTKNSHLIYFKEITFGFMNGI